MGFFGRWIEAHAMLHVLIALAIGFSSFFPYLAYADLTGQVIHVADGDTLTLVINKEWVRVRLAGIDAPEANQPFGTLSKDSLSDLCFWQQVTVIPKGKDQYGRMFAQIHCGDVDAGAEQVRRGMAWVYEHYVQDLGLKPLQADAKAAKRGLWADSYSKPPWEWREVWRE
jgi:micrococcal nuclease